MRVPQRGRAILRRLSAHEPVRVFRPGDFVLTASNGGLARLLSWASGREMNHAALIVDPLGTVIEANPNLLAPGRPFRVASIADYHNAGRPCWVGYVELREGTRHDVVAYAEHVLKAHSETPWLGRLWLLLHTTLSIAPRALCGRFPPLRPLAAVLDRHTVVLREEYCFSSAELVARALERGGFIWDHDPAYITPADLFERYHLADAPVVLVPETRQPARRATATAHSGATTPMRRRSATITPFVPRTTQGATALAPAPTPEEAQQVGVRALLHVGVFMAASLALIGVLEEMLRTSGEL